MTDEEMKTLFESYLGAFAEPSRAGQERLLRSSVAEDVVFTNPGVDGRGLEDLVAHIGAFQERFPGGYFRLHWLREQHGQLLAEWTQLSEDDSELVTAHSFARLDQDGRLAHIAGFWAPGSV